MDVALTDAGRRRHEFSTVEHLLFALLNDPSAQDVLRSAGANIDKLRGDLDAHLDNDVPTVPEGRRLEVRPSLGFSRVVQRAALHVQSSGKEEVGTTNVLVAMFSEPDSYAVYLLEQAGVRRLDVVRYISHGVPGQEPEPGAPPRFEEQGRGAPNPAD